MAKRRLSHQQQNRIRARQQQSRTSAAGGGGADAGALGPERRGLVIAHYGAQLDIEARDAEAGEIWRCHQRANLGETVTGDRVVWRAGPGHGVIEAIEPRRSVLLRPGFGGHLKPVAANIDLIVLVIAPAPEAHANLIDRYLVAAEHTGIETLILLNKHDLLTPASERARQLDELLAGYRAIGYPVLTASSRLERGLDPLRTALHGLTAVFVGQSGVGKSSLINNLIPGLDTAVGALSAAAEKGRHTTTTSRLYHTPCGAHVIDSPGIREFGLSHLDTFEVAAGFKDFQPWLGRCRFRDCSHRHEPDCALREAVAAGRISSARMRSFETIVAELESRS